MMSSTLIGALMVMAAACLVHGAEPAAPAPLRPQLTSDVFPGGLRRSDSDRELCWESLLTLGLCKHDLAASFFTGHPLPRACCRAADEVGHHCGPFSRAFVGSLLPRRTLIQCARTLTTGSPTTTLPVPSRRRAPLRAPGLGTGPSRVPGGGARLAPPRDPTSTRGGSSGTHGTPPPPPVPAPQTSAGVSARPGAPPRIPRGTHTPPPPPVPKPPTGSDLPPDMSVRLPPGDDSDDDDAPAAPPPKPKVIAGGSAGGRTRGAPDAYGAGAGAPLAAAAAPPPRKGARTAGPST
ncbi:hypothetical protein U9M48_033608 [Paspalum notatum var. saurae]|uniref:Prolamin-like domain-containing protein n=1 Tax=Paspalum notatum var. saurae TaxID=547442 RepID=A0AAQ3X5U9_PASNO